MAHDVFISHANQDKAVADAMCSRLEQTGIRCWIAPRDVRPGRNWGSEIIRGLDNAKVMIVVLSANSNDSRPVMKEVERAFGKGIVIISVRTQEVVPSEALEFFLSSEHWLDAITPPLEAHIDRLARTVKEYLIEQGWTGAEGTASTGASSPTTAEQQASRAKTRDAKHDAPSHFPPLSGPVQADAGPREDAQIEPPPFERSARELPRERAVPVPVREERPSLLQIPKGRRILAACAGVAIIVAVALVVMLSQRQLSKEDADETLRSHAASRPVPSGVHEPPLGVPESAREEAPSIEAIEKTKGEGVPSPRAEPPARAIEDAAGAIGGQTKPRSPPAASPAPKLALTAAGSAILAQEEIVIGEYASLTGGSASFGQSSHKGTALAKASGGQIVKEQKYSTGDKDFKPQLTSIKAANPDAIFVPGYYGEVSLIAKQAKLLGIKAPLLGGDGWVGDSLLKVAGNSLDGSFFSCHYASTNKSPKVQQFVKSFKAKYGEVPDDMAALGYDSAMILADAIKRAGTTEPEKLRDAIASTKDYDGITGKITLDAQRNANKPAVILTIRNGGFQFVESVTP